MIMLNQKVVVIDNAGKRFPGHIVNINEYREPCFRYAVDIGADDLVFVGRNNIIPCKE